MKDTMAVDQYGQTYHSLGPNPRKSLLEKLGRTHAEKMYCTTREGEQKHVGYIISGHWFKIYEVTEWTGGKVR